ncbi:hypothetical protein EZV62_007801 [Acer yangbiense]|uniref:Bet v I/Major latex protein domain-containing protein n=1 Tax=Acer yangbiense TaxID=1000413 RepID=A0A5C7IDK7_9ROSI|nr:hypothetical protein EZV62_007801 [Acer yangbiense]
MKIQGKITEETVVVGVGAEEMWKVYSGLELGRLVSELLPHDIGTVQPIQGHGGVGTIVKLTFPPGTPGVGYLKEIFTKIDDEKRVKETETIEGGFKAMGFDLYRIRLEILENSADDQSTIIRSTIEYELDENLANFLPFVTIKPLQTMAETIGKYLCEKKKTTA